VHSYLKNFQFIEFLKRKSFIGQLHPVISSEDQRDPIIGLLVPVQSAIDECELWSGQELSRKEFVTYLKTNNIFLGDADDLLKLKEQRAKNIIRENVMAKAKLYDIADAMEISSLRVDGAKLRGRKGYITAGDNGFVAHVENKSKRHYGSLRKQLAFMEPRSMYNEDIAQFSLDRLPSPDEAELLRKVVGFKKRPALSEERKKQLENHAKEKMGGRTAKIGSVTESFA
jgi:hypothetical protein